MPNQTLLEAAQYIREHGWTTGALMNEDTGEVCAIGALRMVCFDRVEYPTKEHPKEKEYQQAFGCLVDYINADHREAVYSIGIWNDTIMASQEKVIAGMEAAANGCDV